MSDAASAHPVCAKNGCFGSTVRDLKSNTGLLERGF